MKDKPGMAYNTKNLNRVFAVVSIIMLVTVIWMALDDYIRPWKMFQIKALKIQREVLSKKIDEITKSQSKDQIEQINNDLMRAKQVIHNRKEEIDEVKKRQGILQGKIQDTTLINGEHNAQVTVSIYKLEVALANHDHNLKSFKDKLTEVRKKFAESKERLKGFKAQRKALKKELVNLQREKLAADKKMNAFFGAKTRLEAARAKTDTSNPIWILRNAPFFDFLDPTIKIRQVVLDNITDDRYFQHVPKVDRCNTCHTFIDKTGYENYPNPFKTHPKIDMWVGKTSYHPMQKFGCTTCHGGEGHRVNDFQSVAHTPQNAQQQKEWEKKYHWHLPHKIPEPMLKLQNVEASCVKCHRNVERVAGATVLNRGLDLIEKHGCFACHRISGLTHLKKPGPSLEKIASKVNKSFFKKWVWNPHQFNKKSKMASFFGQSNNNTPEFRIKNTAEVNAITEYIWSKSKQFKPLLKYEKGDAKKGAELISSIGCLGCHTVEGIAISEKSKGYKGTYLTGLGSKVRKDWLVSWLRRPSHFQKNTIMPSFRLSKRQINDIATYLLSLRNRNFEKRVFPKLDTNVRDELLVEYYSDFDTKEVARSKISKMSSHARTLELGERSIAKYGCYSCHQLEGFAGRSPLGADLSQFGVKPITQFYFGHEKIAHTREDWLKSHLSNPRRWDHGVDKPFKDLSRMPQFYLSEKDINAIAVVILGQVPSKTVPLEGQKILSADEANIERGAKVINKFNCMGCHQIDGVRGDILAVYEDDINDGPPRLIAEGARVQTHWLHSFLQNVRPIRPWLKVRMPSFKFTNLERNEITSYFQIKAKEIAFVDLPKTIRWQAGEKKVAKKLFAELDCASCHTAGFNKDEQLAPDLHLVRTRLRPAWIAKWLEEPQKILEGTSMPSFWEDGEAEAENILGGNPQAQIKILTKYLLEMGQGQRSN